MSNNTKKDYTQLHIHASEHPKAYAPHILILNIVMSVLGAIIGLELIVRTGVAPNTSIVGALFAIIISRIPIAILKKYQSIHCQNLIQTSISGATFSAANCFLLPIGVPVIMGRMDLMYPMLIGSFLATIIDATILYKTFDSEMFPAEGAWPPGVASAESILAVVQKGKKALLLLAGMGIGIGGKMIGIPTDLLGVSWFGDFAAIASELIVGISAMYSGWFPGFATALIFLIVGMLIGFPAIPLGILVAYTSATGPAFSDMAYDLKCGYILRGCGQDQELELEGRKQQYYSEMIGFVVAFVLVAIMAGKYFDQGLFAPVDATFAATIEAGAGAGVAKWLVIWAIPGAIIQLLGGSRQVGILFATGLLVGSTINGLTILIALVLRYVLVKRNKENEQTLNILGAGSLAGAALYSFFTATLSLGKKK